MKRTLSIVLALCMLLALLAACGGETESPATDNPTTQTPADEPGSETPGDEEPSESGEPRTVSFGTSDAFGNGFNPLSSVEGNNLIGKLLYDYLIELDPVTGEHSSRICEEYYWEDDGVTYFFKLKEGITYSNGAELTGEDVLSSLEIMQTAGNSYSANYSVILTEECYVDEDGLGVHLVFDGPYGPADSLLMSLPILDKDFCETHPDGDEEWWNNPVGSGPYMLGDYQVDSYVTVVKRDDYWGEDIYEADEITVRYYSDSNTMFIDFQNAVIDVALMLTDDQVAQLEADPSMGAVVTQSAADVPVVCLNETSEIIQDPAVREAICYGVDWAAVADIAWGELSIPATSHFGVNYSCYVEHEGYTHDPDRAAQVLSDAGYSEGDITLRFLVMGTVQQQRVAEAVQGYLSEVGITVSVESYDQSTVLGMYMQGDTDLSIFSLTGLGATLEPWNSLAVYSATGPFPCMTVSDPDYNELLNQGLVTNDAAERDAIYQKVDDWLYDNYWVVPICERLEAYCYNNTKLTGIDLPSIQGVALYSVHFA